mmetsp:Transcript_1013/g.2166  ORF Transcript_1013/g.2166 Transcript_1013/m.2166 type:complete len:82 (+) Transcript_1013:568-813(+)
MDRNEILSQVFWFKATVYWVCFGIEHILVSGGQYSISGYCGGESTSCSSKHMKALPCEAGFTILDLLKSEFAPESFRGEVF